MSNSTTTYSLSNQSMSSENTSATSIKDEMSGWDTPVEGVYHHETIWNTEKTTNLPILTVNNGDHMLFRTYDPEYLHHPPPKQVLKNKEKIVEKSFFFDLIQERVNAHLTRQQAQEDLETARRLLANSIAVHLVSTLWILPDESSRHKAIRDYIKNKAYTWQLYYSRQQTARNSQLVL
ncbi:hypothetical protein INT45_010984 [Circinella minor]|uniref:Uncharacterized protein n=1 Tax=Circinella minor TaxID=1195481 RepID=A0A8H7RZH8_9FUNG|nr:hypothetical protein INT45_010984 [Circinella minor]